MKKLIIGVLALTVGGITPAIADTYVKVDANGNTISTQIVCDYDTCGNPNSLFNKMTLGVGEKWVLQNKENWGMGGSPDLTYDFNTKIWTNKSTNTYVDKVTGIKETTTTITKYAGTIDNPISTEVIKPQTVSNTTSNNTTINTLINQIMNLISQLVLLMNKG